MKAIKCTICHKRDMFYFRRYSGEYLCKKCYMQSIEEKVRYTISKFDMFNHDDKIAVAVSGGKDSVSLLHILAKREKRYPEALLTAITVDEGIKGYRDEALRIAKRNCKELDVKHHTVSFKQLYGLTLDQIVARSARKMRSLTPCAICGVLRRRAMNAVAREVGADKIATGHTLDDETQTILLNILHGDVLRIAREKPVTDRIHPNLIQKVKPFCEIPEKETAMYAYLRNIDFQSKPCPYASEAMRNDVRRVLDSMENKHAGTKFSISASIGRIRPALEELDRKQKLRECLRCGEPTSERICRACQLLGEIQHP